MPRRPRTTPAVAETVPDVRLWVAEHTAGWDVVRRWPHRGRDETILRTADETTARERLAEQVDFHRRQGYTVDQ